MLPNGLGAAAGTPLQELGAGEAPWALGPPGGAARAMGTDAGEAKPLPGASRSPPEPGWTIPSYHTVFAMIGKDSRAPCLQQQVVKCRRGPERQYPGSGHRRSQMGPQRYLLAYTFGVLFTLLRLFISPVGCLWLPEVTVSELVHQITELAGIW